MKKVDIWPAYVDRVLSFIDVSALAPLKVVIDAANGMAGAMLPPVVEPGTALGEVLPQWRNDLGTARVIAPATHDTGSAIVATPTQLASGWGYISSGTWSLVGVELPQPVMTPGALAANFTNEGGVFGTTRFLKNVMGLWLLQECQRSFARNGQSLEYDALLANVDAAPTFAALILATSAPTLSATCAISLTSPWNCSLRATKSVSELTSTTTPLGPAVTAPIRPSAATRPAFFAAFDRPFLRSQSIAACMSPAFSASACLQSIMPTPVVSRRSLTIAAVIVAIVKTSSACQGGSGAALALAAILHQE